jgi:TIR domain
MPPDSRAAFICYRRNDCDSLAGRLRDRMRQALPGWTIFMDVDSIKPGLDFRVEINAALKRTSVFLLLIGRDWLGAEVNRLLRADDPVLHEIRLALALGLRFIPILANDAKMPNPAQFPEEIRSVAWLNGLELRHSRFEDDFQNLVSAFSGEQSPSAALLGESSSFRGVRRIIMGALLAIALGLIGLIINFQTTGKSASDWLGDDGASLLLPILAIIGGAAGLLLRRGRT